MSFANLKPIKVWGKGGPNPPKVAILLEELGVPYDAISVPLSDIKKPEYIAINPNGRLPTIYDPNTDIKLWETGAIIEYLIDKYDPEHKFSFAPGTPEYYLSRQYLFFQVSGQGPYYGQAAWFKVYHQEKIPSAVERYVKEINRVTGVLQAVLSENAKKDGGGGDGPWLVGGKYSFADLAFVSWQLITTRLLSKDEYDRDAYPTVAVWVDKMLARKAVEAGFSQGAKLG